ncbi:hypothetical protein Hdeb2414_s0948g00965341 [Helianthus debilis subsp. tardiflorus]
MVVLYMKGILSCGGGWRWQWWLWWRQWWQGVISQSAQNTRGNMKGHYSHFKLLVNRLVNKFKAGG